MLMIVQLTANPDFIPVVKALGVPKAVFYSTTGDITTSDQAYLSAWAFMDDERAVFYVTFANNPVGTVANDITALTTAFPSAVELSASGGFQFS